MAQHQAMAEFGQPTQAADIGLFKGLRSNPQPGQLQEMMELVTAHWAQMQLIDEPLRAIRGQVSDQLAGSGTVDAAELDALAQQAFALRAQEDTLNLAEQVALRAFMTPAQIAAAAELHQHSVALNARDDGVESSPRFTTSVYRPGDLFGDRLGYSRGLTLTDDQYVQMNNIRAANMAALDAIQQRRHAVRRLLDEQMGGSGAVTVAALAPLQQQATALKDQLDMLRLNMTIEIRAILTPDQLGRAAELHQHLATLHAQETAAEIAAMDQARSGN
jgi:hypothetical protein